ncbi:DMT family transporter [Pectobacterium jejuense]|uniref:DMT family transporter n=1 Tax=Pectobacterium jejuense TaxID=2974022 RepID=UPI00228265E5|nr:multidrug efflux SMR transporter [Pectobacterium jejuense]MCY9848897.1 multidrug efflux SMR transporter [Pectobacterium jejuense]
MQPFIAYLALTAAIVSEVTGTLFLGKSEHFTRLMPSLLAIVAYAFSFYMLAQALRVVPLAVAYASWGGLGIILTAVVGVVVFRQKPDAAALVGIALIVAGVVIVNGFSKMSAH